MNADEQRGTDIQIVVDSSGKQANPWHPIYFSDSSLSESKQLQGCFVNTCGIISFKNDIPRNPYDPENSGILAQTCESPVLSALRKEWKRDNVLRFYDSKTEIERWWSHTNSFYSYPSVSTISAKYSRKGTRTVQAALV